MSLVGLMVGILSHDDYLNVGDGGCGKGIKDVLLFGIDLNRCLGTFFPD